MRRRAVLVALAAVAVARIWTWNDTTPAAVAAALRNRALLALLGPSAACSLLPVAPTILAGRRVVLEDGTEGPAAIALAADGTISSVIPLSPAAAQADLAAAVALATGRRGPAVRLAAPAAIIAPAAVDAHVHANDPGRSGWEGLASATRAAAAGGVGTIVDMPLNSHPSATSAAVLRSKIRAAAAFRPLAVDVAFWAGLVPENAGDPAELLAMAAAGARGFKTFMTPSGIADFGNVSAAHIASALPTLMAAGLPLLIHAEDMDAAPPGTGGAPPSDLAGWEASRPPACEASAVRAVCDVVVAAMKAGPPPSPGFRVHIAHVGAPDAVLPAIASARAAGAPISGEAVPHALGGLPYPERAPRPGDPAAALWKCAPPLRGPAAARGLWSGLLSNTLSTIGSDHSPAHPDLKLRTTFARAWGGIAGLQFSLPAVWTAAAKHAEPGGVTPARLAGWMATGPAALARLSSKGRIAPGYDADVVVWDPTAPADTSPAACHQRHPSASPYLNAPLTGRVLETYVRGNLVFQADESGGKFAVAACGRVVVDGGEGGRARKQRGLAGSAAAATAAAHA